MQELSYEFDPCSLDGSDQDVNYVSIDDWTPRVVPPRVPKSDWRAAQNNGCHDNQPGIDDINKIKMYIKKRFADAQIMDVFGITAETLVAIKNNHFCPIEGITLDNQSKIYNEFNKITKITNKLYEALAYLSDTLLLENTFEKASFEAMIDYVSIKKRQDKEQKRAELKAKKKEQPKLAVKTVKKEQAKAVPKPKEKKKRVNISIGKKSYV